MEFRCERDVLVDALSTTTRAAAGRGGSLPILSGVRLEVADGRLRLAGSDLDLTIQIEVDVNEVTGGVAVVPARLVTDIVRSLPPGVITFAIEHTEMHITSGRSLFAVRALAADEFPRLPFPITEAQPQGDIATLKSSALSDALRQVVRAASADEATPVISGVLMTAEASGLRLVATDRYRLAVRDLPGTSVLREGQKVLVPSRALAELQRLLAGAEDVTLRLGERDASFEVANMRLTTRLIEGPFPPYERLIPEGYPNRLIINKEAFVDAVRRVRLLVKDAITPVRVTLRPDGVECTVVTQEVGQATEDVDAKYEGTDLVIGFNPAYLLDGLDAIQGNEVVLETESPSKPAVLRTAEGDDYLYLLMPVRLAG